MTAATTTERRPSPLAQWWVLTKRFIAPTLRNGELVVTIASSVVFTAGFYIPLHQVMGTATKSLSSSYAQYVMPLIALQAITFAAMSTAFRAATDSVQGINRRFRSMPMTPFAPVACPHLGRGIPVRDFGGGGGGLRLCDRIPVPPAPVYTAAFVLLVIAIGSILSFGADLVGTGSRNPAAMTPLLILPPLIFGLLSTGVQPVQQFPHWIQPIVRNQPVSQFVTALRALAGDTAPYGMPVTWSLLAPTLAWLAGLIALLIPTSVVVLSRRTK